MAIGLRVKSLDIVLYWRAFKKVRIGKKKIFTNDVFVIVIVLKLLTQLPYHREITYIEEVVVNRQPNK